MPDSHSLERFSAANGAEIYRIPLEVFSGYIAYAHLVLVDSRIYLVDVGSGLGKSHGDLLTGIEAIRETYGRSIRLEDIDKIIVTHGHVDHFGGLSLVKQVAPQAEVAAHDLVRPVLVNYDERVLVTVKNMRDFLRRAGVPDERRSRLMDMYMIGKQAYKSVPVGCSVKGGDLLDGALRIFHVPGHAPGLLMIQIDNILLTADHILPETSVALAPEGLVPYTGVGHYLDSLEAAQSVEGVDLALGGHEWPMPDYYAVARRTRIAAQEKVERVLVHCDEPRTIYEISRKIYSNLEGYGEMLKLWQTGARVEYLNLRGQVAIENLADLETEENPVLRYRRV